MSCKEPNGCETEAQRFHIAQYGWVQSTANRVAANRSLQDYADDIVNDAYFKCGKISNEYWATEIRDHKFYLTRIIINLANELCVKRNRERELFPYIILPSDALQNARDADFLGEVLEKLPSHEFKLYELFYYYGYTGREIAQGLGITEVTVRKRISRIKKKVKMLSQQASKDNPENGADRASLKAF